MHVALLPALLAASAAASPLRARQGAYETAADITSANATSVSSSIVTDAPTAGPVVSANSTTMPACPTPFTVVAGMNSTLHNETYPTGRRPTGFHGPVVTGTRFNATRLNDTMPLRNETGTNGTFGSYNGQPCSYTSTVTVGSGPGFHPPSLTLAKTRSSAPAAKSSASMFVSSISDFASDSTTLSYVTPMPTFGASPSAISAALHGDSTAFESQSSEVPNYSSVPLEETSAAASSKPVQSSKSSGSQETHNVGGITFVSSITDFASDITTLAYVTPVPTFGAAPSAISEALHGDSTAFSGPSSQAPDYNSASPEATSAAATSKPFPSSKGSESHSAQGGALSFVSSISAFASDSTTLAYVTPMPTFGAAPSAISAALHGDSSAFASHSSAAASKGSGGEHSESVGGLSFVSSISAFASDSTTLAYVTPMPTFGAAPSAISAALHGDSSAFNSPSSAAPGYGNAQETTAAASSKAFATSKASGGEHSGLSFVSSISAFASDSTTLSYVTPMPTFGAAPSAISAALHGDSSAFNSPSSAAPGYGNAQETTRAETSKPNTSEKPEGSAPKSFVSSISAFASDATTLSYVTPAPSFGAAPSAISAALHGDSSAFATTSAAAQASAPGYGGGDDSGSAAVYVSTAAISDKPAAGQTLYPTQMTTPSVGPSGKPVPTLVSTQTYVDKCKTPSASLPPLAAPTDDSLSGWMLYYHNIHRRNHSAPDMAWSMELELDAVKQIGQHNSSDSKAPSCQGGHVMQIDSDQYGQNIASASGGGSGTAAIEADFVSSNQAAAKSATDMWYAEGECWSADKFGNKANLEENHFTQLIWKDSVLLGCAVQQCGYDASNSHGSGYWVVCNYEKPGNDGDASQISPPLCQPPASQVTPQHPTTTAAAAHNSTVPTGTAKSGNATATSSRTVSSHSAATTGSSGPGQYGGNNNGGVSSGAASASTPVTTAAATAASSPAANGYKQVSSSTSAAASSSSSAPAVFGPPQGYGGGMAPSPTSTAASSSSPAPDAFGPPQGYGGGMAPEPTAFPEKMGNYGDGY